MASLCRRQQCTVERRGFRQELDSWRHKLIHCVGKLSWHCVCASVWRGAGGRRLPVTGFCVLFSCGAAGQSRVTGKPIGSHEAVIFFFFPTPSARLLPGAPCLPPDTVPSNTFALKFEGSCRAGGQVVRLQTLGLRPVRLLMVCFIHRVSGLEPRGYFFGHIYIILSLFVYCKQGMSRVQMELRLSQSASPL